MVKFIQLSGILIFVTLVCAVSLNKGHAQEANLDTLAREYKTLGFENVTGEYFLFSGGKSVLALHTVNGYRPNPLFFVGIGAGLEFYPETYLIPLFVESRVNFIEGRFSPIIYFDAGYAFGRNDSLDRMIQMGPVLSTGIGFKASIQDELVISISLGYKYQMAKFHKNLNLMEGVFVEHNINDYHMLAVRFELVF